MIDWGARIDELALALRRQHEIDDRLALEVLLSALVDCPRTPATWLVIETPWLERDCREAWFSFGESWEPFSFARFRARGPWSVINNQFIAWLDDPNVPRLLVEPDYEKYPKFGNLPNARFVLERALRVRVYDDRKTTCVLDELDLANHARRRSELGGYARMAIEDRANARAADPPRFVAPPDFLYYVELVQKLAPFYKDWRMLVRSFAAIAIRHAHLYGRTETGPEEHVILARIAADMVPAWIIKVMRLVLSREVCSLSVLANAMLLEDAAHKSQLVGPKFEARRLHRNGIMEVSWGPGSAWRIVERHRIGVQKLIDGCAFGVSIPAPTPLQLMQKRLKAPLPPGTPLRRAV